MHCGRSPYNCDGVKIAFKTCKMNSKTANSGCFFFVFIQKQSPDTIHYHFWLWMLHARLIVLKATHVCVVLVVVLELPTKLNGQRVNSRVASKRDIFKHHRYFCLNAVVDPLMSVFLSVDPYSRQIKLRSARILLSRTWDCVWTRLLGWPADLWLILFALNHPNPVSVDRVSPAVLPRSSAHLVQPVHTPQWLDSPPTRVTLSTQTDLDYLLANSIIFNNEWMEFWIRPIPEILQINRGHLESVFIIGFVHWRALVSHKTATGPRR